VTTTINSAKIRAELENQIAEQARANRIESGRRLVEEQDVWIERHRARQSRSLLHSAADLIGVEVFEALEPDQRELERGDLPDLRRGQIGELAERQADILLPASPNSIMRRSGRGFRALSSVPILRHNR
jgi:hypothetical protein